MELRGAGFRWVALGCAEVRNSWTRKILDDSYYFCTWSATAHANASANAISMPMQVQMQVEMQVQKLQVYTGAS